MTSLSLWQRYRSYLCYDRNSEFVLDISRVKFGEDFLQKMEPNIRRAYEAMEKLEQGGIANPDEQRMVGHYWLRRPSLSPNGEIKAQIESTLMSIKTFAAEVHAGKIAPEKGGTFQYLLVVGIGGSALGPQFVTQALGNANDKLKVFFLDNTDPDGMDKVLASIPALNRTLTIVISKSGGTKETRNGQLVAKAAYAHAKLNFAKHFVAVTSVGSELDKTAVSEGWLARFPMWDWVGGRTSELSAVGLLPAALQGYDIDRMLAGAAYMDELTINRDTLKNPAALMALMWYQVGSGRGLKDMVVLPYKDRLELFSRYLQQLVMESIGKEKDLNSKVVNQGIAVYGNKGSTDQHAYVQQLREGINNFFAVFIEVMADASPVTKASFSSVGLTVEPGITCGDYLNGFYLGTRRALYEKERESVTITVKEVSPFTIGMLIAMFERAVGLYAILVNVNAYHQPGVEAGKKAAGDVLALQQRIVEFLKVTPGTFTAEAVAAKLGETPNTETVFKILRHLAANEKLTLTIKNQAYVFEDEYGGR